MTPLEPDVRVGDVWRDNDPRQQQAERELHVLELLPDGARCRVFKAGKDMNRVVNVALRRFKPTSSGYRLERRAIAAEEKREAGK